MSYCKHGLNSDVYLYSSIDHASGSPCWVLLTQADRHPELLPNRQAVIDRLLALRGEGLRVPDEALDRLRREMEGEKG